MKQLISELPIHVYKRQQPSNLLPNHKPFTKPLNFHKIFSYKSPTPKVKSKLLTKRNTIEDEILSYNSTVKGKLSKIASDKIVSIKKKKHLIPKITSRKSYFKVSPRKCRPSNSTTDSLHRIKVYANNNSIV